MALLETEITDDFEPQPNASIDKLKARFQSTIRIVKALRPDVVPIHLAKCEEMYATARILAGQISAHYYEQYIILKIGADQSEITIYQEALAAGQMEKDARRIAKLEKLAMQKEAGLARAEYMRWNSIYCGYEQMINSLKDRIKIIQSGL